MTTSQITSKFERWMADVDAAVAGYCGLSVYDLADACYDDLYDDGLTADEAARAVLAEEGFGQ